jgi:hypothetical protein
MLLVAPVAERSNSDDAEQEKYSGIEKLNISTI